MTPKKLTPAEFKTEDEDEAELVASISDMIYFFDKEEKNYKLITEDEVQSRIKKLYDEDKYTEAEELIDAIDRVSSKDTEEMFRESKSKSYRLSKVEFVKAVKKAYKENMSVADILRFNISKKIESNLKNLYQNPEIDQERLKSLEKIVKKWSMKEGRSPLKEGYKLGFRIGSDYSEEKYDTFASNFLRKTFLEKKIDDEKLINIYLNYYNIADPYDLFPYSSINLRLCEEGDNLNLSFDYELNYILGLHNMDEIDDFLSDIANQGYNKEELNDLPVFNKFYNLLAEIVESIKEGYRGDIEPNPIAYDEHTWREVIDENSWPRLEIRIPLEIKDESITFGEGSLEKDSVKKTVLEKILETFDSELKCFNIDEAKQEAVEYIKNEEYSSAKHIHKQISLYDASKYMAGIIERIILDGLSSQVVSLTMPKGVYALLKIFDLKKEDILW